jgi:CheY-like chemotaxis protein
MRRDQGMKGKGTILAIGDDLFFIPRLEDAARGMGFVLKTVGKPEDLQLEGEATPREISLTEPLEGPDADLVRHLVTDRPALILLDTACRSVPWHHWVRVLKTSAATLRIPIVAYGSHVEEDVLESARRVGADLVVSRGRLQHSLDEIIQSWAVLPDIQSIEADCENALAHAASKGIWLINEGQFFEAHEVLEEAWISAEDNSRYLLRSLLQTSVIYLHIERGNIPGAKKMLLRVREWLRPLPNVCQGVNIAQLRRDLNALEGALDIAPEEQSLSDAIRPIITN